LSALGLGSGCKTIFETCQSVEYGGVLFLLPFLIVNGLMSFKQFFTDRNKGYYTFRQLILSYAFMLLCRIKTVEQSKHLSPGEFGKLLGIDRLPESKRLRLIFKELVIQKRATDWGMYLSEEWIKEDNCTIFYVDGHVQVYHGYLGNLGKKHVSRQKLCLPGMMEFWVNDCDGKPFFFVTGQVNEKLQQALEREIIPELLRMKNITISEIDKNSIEPIFTIVFDREAYSLDFFARLWKEYHIAVITYNKNVKDLWDENEFTKYTIDTEYDSTQMNLSERQFEVHGVKMREIRKQNTSSHQTSIISTNQILTINILAKYMFARWCQENFFRYMRQEYAIDKIIEYGVDNIDKDIIVVNREYSNLTYELKKTREKISRRKAILYVEMEKNNKDTLESTGKYLKKELEIREELEVLEKHEEELVAQRKQIPYHIKIGQMSEDTRYNKLKAESKHLLNIIKIICYRADIAFANMLAPYYKKSSEERMALVKSIIFSKADIEPDYVNNQLIVTLYSLATPRDNAAVKSICNYLNDTETKFPGTELNLIYKTATI